MQGHCDLTDDWSALVSSTAGAHFGCSFGCVLLLDQIFRKQCTIGQYTTPIYLINLLWKLVIGLGLDSELHYFSIFHRE